MEKNGGLGNGPYTDWNIAVAGAVGKDGNAGPPGTSGFGTETSIASASTCDLGSTGAIDILVTGTTGISSFGSSASTSNCIYLVKFSGVLTLFHSGGTLNLPGSLNIKTQANDYCFAQYMGAGQWRVLAYYRANGQVLSIFGPSNTVASNTTTDIGSFVTNNITISGNNTINSLGTSAPAFSVFLVTLSGSPQLTHNATSLILPGGANIAGAAGDTFIAQHLGSGNWRVHNYTKASGQPVGAPATQSEAEAGTDNAKFMTALRTKQAITANRRIMNVQRFYGNGVYTPTTGAKYADFELVGPGGPGAGGAGSSTPGSDGTDSSNVTVVGSGSLSALSLTAGGGKAGKGGTITGAGKNGAAGANGQASGGDQNLDGSGAPGGIGGAQWSASSGYGDGGDGGNGARCLKFGVDVSGGGTAAITIPAPGAIGSQGSGGSASPGTLGGYGWVIVTEWSA